MNRTKLIIKLLYLKNREPVSFSPFTWALFAGLPFFFLIIQYRNNKMAKRFTDTEKYRKPFLRGLQGAYKLLWDFLYHDCNHAGIWIKDFEIAQIYIGNDMPINE